ncbi:MAG: transposase [Verrucomicrobiae bacterium]|nr:transposase [Verrucomicrobiae bacterium]
MSLAMANLVLAGSETEMAEAVLDKGYHDNGLLVALAERGIRSYIPERRQKTRRWTDKPAEYEAAFRANRRRVRGNKGRQLNRWRSERCERTFAHTCETGGGRRCWVRGQTNVSKVHTLRCAAYNVGLLLRKAWGMGKPRSAAAAAAGFCVFLWLLTVASILVCPTNYPPISSWLDKYGWLLVTTVIAISFGLLRNIWKNRRFLTG